MELHNLVVRYADGVNIGDKPSPSRYQERLDDLKAACGRLGRDFCNIQRSHFTGLIISSNRDSLDIQLKEIAQAQKIDIEEVKARFRGFIGTPEEVLEFLQQYVEISVEQFMFVFLYGHEEDSLKLMADRVFPRL